MKSNGSLHYFSDRSFWDTRHLVLCRRYIEYIWNQYSLQWLLVKLSYKQDLFIKSDLPNSPRQQFDSKDTHSTPPRALREIPLAPTNEYNQELYCWAKSKFKQKVLTSVSYQGPIFTVTTHQKRSKVRKGIFELKRHYGSLVGPHKSYMIWFPLLGWLYMLVTPFISFGTVQL